MAANLTKSSFDPHLNSKFTVVHEAIGELEVELVHIVDKKAEGQEAFSVEFKGPEDKPLSQGNHTFKHGKMGEFNLFIVPVERVENGFLYQAVFSRPAK